MRYNFTLSNRYQEGDDFYTNNDVEHTGAQRQYEVFFKSKKTNLVLIIPIATVLIPSTIGYPFSAPLLLTEPPLAIAHLFYLMLFSIAALKTLSYINKKYFQHSLQGKSNKKYSRGNV